MQQRQAGAVADSGLRGIFLENSLCDVQPVDIDGHFDICRSECVCIRRIDAVERAGSVDGDVSADLDFTIGDIDAVCVGIGIDARDGNTPAGGQDDQTIGGRLISGENNVSCSVQRDAAVFVVHADGDCTPAIGGRDRCQILIEGGRAGRVGVEGDVAVLGGNEGVVPHRDDLACIEVDDPAAGGAHVFPDEQLLPGIGNHVPAGRNDGTRRYVRISGYLAGRAELPNGVGIANKSKNEDEPVEIWGKSGRFGHILSKKNRNERHFRRKKLSDDCRSIIL